MEFISDLIVNIGAWLQGVIAGTGLPEGWVTVIMSGIGGFALAIVPFAAMGCAEASRPHAGPPRSE